ncbi:MAG: TRAP transporter small permease subunit [Desulfobacterales bacterium]|nr:TRAP transporter small permease subunit [Desulfobacterales bacterium]
MSNNDIPAVCRFLDAFLIKIGRGAAWLSAVLIAVIILQVALRYLLGISYVALEEIQWHIYAVIILLGMSYAMVTDSHIRLDLLHLGFSQKKKEWVEVLGILFFLLPMIWVFFYHSLDFVAESWMVSERSEAPMGLGCRWAIKSMIPISFTLLFLAAVSRLIKGFHRIFFMKGGKEHGR